MNSTANIHIKNIYVPKLPYSHAKHSRNLSSLHAKPPSQHINNVTTINWLTRKYGVIPVKHNLLSILPSNTNNHSNKPIATPTKTPNMHVHPKYFYTKDDYEKILKLRDLFLALDETGNQRSMEITQLKQMFKMNNINVSKKQLIDLFFTDNKSPNDINKLVLDFDKFISFATEKEQNFNDFMRNIRQTHKPKGTGAANQKNGMYFPNNFDLLLKYFIKKRKENKGKLMVKKAIKEMDSVITSVKSSFNNINNAPIKQSERNVKIDNTQFKKVNFWQIMKQFEGLFNLNNTHSSDNNTSHHKSSSVNYSTKQFVTPELTPIRNKKQIPDKEHHQTFYGKTRMKFYKKRNTMFNLFSPPRIRCSLSNANSVNYLSQTKNNYWSISQLSSNNSTIYTNNTKYNYTNNNLQLPKLVKSNSMKRFKMEESSYKGKYKNDYVPLQLLSN